MDEENISGISRNLCEDAKEGTTEARKMNNKRKDNRAKCRTCNGGHFKPSSVFRGTIALGFDKGTEYPSTLLAAFTNVNQQTASTNARTIKSSAASVTESISRWAFCSGAQ